MSLVFVPKLSLTVIWSRAKGLLNVLHTFLHTVLLGGTPVGVPWGQQAALVEDVALRGFAPLVRSQEALSFSPQTTPSQLEQVYSTVYQCMCRIEHFSITVSAHTYIHMCALPGNHQDHVSIKIWKLCCQC